MYAAEFCRIAVYTADICQIAVRVPADAEHLPWDEPESLDHDLVLSVLKAEAEDQTLDCLIFEGFKAFHDERVVALLQMYVWLQVPRDVAQKRRMARCSGCSEQHFDQQIWADCAATACTATTSYKV